MRTFAVGDVHGCFDELRALLDKIPLAGGDRLVFLGDYIDRGRESRKVVDFLIGFAKERTGETVFLKGNHEQMFLDYLATGAGEKFLLNGGRQTLLEYTENGVLAVPGEHLAFFRDLALLYVTEGYVFVHAGLMPGVAVDSQREDDLLWIRGEFICSGFDFGRMVIYGHTPTRDHLPFFDKNKIGIDTGAVYGGFLTAIELPGEKIYQV